MARGKAAAADREIAGRLPDFFLLPDLRGEACFCCGSDAPLAAADGLLAPCAFGLFADFGPGPGRVPADLALVAGLRACLLAAAFVAVVFAGRLRVAVFGVARFFAAVCLPVDLRLLACFFATLRVGALAADLGLLLARFVAADFFVADFFVVDFREIGFFAVDFFVARLLVAGCLRAAATAGLVAFLRFVAGLEAATEVFRFFTVPCLRAVLFFVVALPVRVLAMG